MLLKLKRAKNKMLYLLSGVRSGHLTLLLKALRHHSRSSHVLVIGRIHFEAKDERNKVGSATRGLVQDREMATGHHTQRRQQHVCSTAVKIFPLWLAGCMKVLPLSFLHRMLLGVLDIHSPVPIGNKDGRDESRSGRLCYLSQSVGVGVGVRGRYDSRVQADDDRRG